MKQSHRTRLNLKNNQTVFENRTLVELKIGYTAKLFLSGRSILCCQVE